MRESTVKRICRLLCLCLGLAVFFALSDSALAEEAAPGLEAEWLSDQDFVLADPAPWTLEELKKVVDVQDPRSVAAYWVWAVTRLTDSYDDGMDMMKYLFADIDVFGKGFTEGGLSGKAGWDDYFTSRLDDGDYSWLPRTYFNGGTKDNGFTPARPMTIELYYNEPNTKALNSQSLNQLGRLNLVYWVKSHSSDDGNQVNIVLNQFEGSDRWYVTNGVSSSALFFDQRSALTGEQLAKAKETKNDASTQEEHAYRYSDDYAEPTLEQRENVQAFVQRMYRKVLNRNEDKDGLQDWTNQLLGHRNNGAGIACGFFLSPEMIKRGLSDEEYVEVLYETFFKRASDPVGKEYWLDMLKDHDRNFVLAGFVNSKEFEKLCGEFGIEPGSMYEDATPAKQGVEGFVQRIYIKALQRNCDADGLADWSGKIRKKLMTPEEVAKNFFFSAEYTGKNTSDNEFVETLYKTFMGRNADAAGKADWLNALITKEKTRTQVLEGFSRSKEFADIQKEFGL